MFKLFQIMCFAAPVLLLNGCNSRSSQEQPDASKLQKLHSDPATAYYLVEAEEALRRHAYRVALALSDSAAQRAPDLADVYFLRGNIYTELGQLAKADDAYLEVLSLEPDYRGAWFNLGNNALRDGRFEQALVFFRREMTRHSHAGTLVNMGRAYTELGKPDSARQVLLEALEIDHTFSAAHIRLGQVYEDTGQMEQALAHSQHALSLDPEDLNYRYIVGSQLFRLGKTEEAVAHLTPVKQQLPCHSGAHYYLGQAHARLGRRVEAKHLLARADSLQLLESELKQAQLVAEMQPERAENWIAAAKILQHCGRLEEAAQNYAVALSFDPWNLSLQQMAANLHLQRGYIAEAIRRYRMILHQDSTFADAWLNLGIAYARMQQYQLADESWQTVLLHTPDDSLAAALLARLRDQS